MSSEHNVVVDVGTHSIRVGDAGEEGPNWMHTFSDDINLRTNECDVFKKSLGDLGRLVHDYYVSRTVTNGVITDFDSIQRL